MKVNGTITLAAPPEAFDTMAGWTLSNLLECEVYVIVISLEEN